MSELQLIVRPSKLFTQDIWHLETEPLRGHEQKLFSCEPESHRHHRWQRSRHLSLLRSPKT